MEVDKSEATYKPLMLNLGQSLLCFSVIHLFCSDKKKETFDCSEFYSMRSQMSFLERLEKVNTLYALQVNILEKKQQQWKKTEYRIVAIPCSKKAFLNINPSKQPR